MSLLREQIGTQFDGAQQIVNQGTEYLRGDAKSELSRILFHPPKPGMTGSFM